MVEFDKEESRIKAVYAKRDAAKKPALYAWHREEVLLNVYRFKAVIAQLLVENGITSLLGLKALDVGCGTGGWLRTLMEWGASPNGLRGIDLLQDRIDQAKILAPLIDFRIASGYTIPFPDATFDLASAHTVFSSILDGLARMALAEEMIRVVKPNGNILIYDYRISDPRNPDTTGIRKSEIRRLFPDMPITMKSLTLAPPLARRIAPMSPLLIHILEAMCPFLRTHAMYLIKKREMVKG